MINQEPKRYLWVRKDWTMSIIEDCLWGQGFKVIQRDGSRYLKFIGDEKRLTWFLLKHGELQ